MREIYVENEVSPFRSSSHPPSGVCASGPCAAAIAAFNALRLLAAEVQTLDSSTCGLVEKLLSAAAKRRSTIDSGSLTSVQQQQHTRQLEHQEANPEEWTQAKLPPGSQEERQLWHQQQQEQQLLRERELLLFWSEAALLQKKAKKGTGRIPLSPQTPGKREVDESEESIAEEEKCAGPYALKIHAQRMCSATEAAGETEADAKAQAEETSFSRRPACGPAAAAATVCDDGGQQARTSAFVAGGEATAGRQNAFPATAAAAQPDPRASAAAAALVEMERLLVALQELLNRLYNVALHAQHIVDVLSWRLGPTLAQRVVAARPLPVATAVPAGGAALPPPAAALGAAVSAASAAGGPAAALTGGAALAAEEVSAATSAARAATEEEKKEEEDDPVEEKDRAQEEQTEQEGEDGGRENRGGDTEAARGGMFDVPSTPSIGTRPASAAEEKRTLEQSHQPQKEEQQQQPKLQRHGFSQEKLQVHVEEQRQGRHCEGQSQPQEQQQQLFAQPQQQQASEVQQRSSHERQSSQQQQQWESAQQQNELAAVADCPEAAQRQEQGDRVAKAEEREERCKRLAALLQLCEALVKTIEGDWRFKQEVKEEMHFGAPLGVFLAAKAAWTTRPYVSDLAPLLREAASLVEECRSRKHQQGALRSSSDSNKQQQTVAAPSVGADGRSAAIRQC